jgi:DNA-binding GntR family transcriptional regulator
MTNLEIHADAFAVPVDETHTRIVAALEGGDAESAAAATLEHLELTMGWAHDA